MVRNGLGVDARGGRVRATSATSSTRVVVVEDAPFIDIGEALRVALASARAKFGEPEAIALVHDDALPAGDLELLRSEAQKSHVGEVRLVPESVARPLAENEDVAPALVPATGAAIWLLRERRGIVVPPPLPPRQERDDTTRKMEDFGQGRRMSDFGGGSAMADHGDGRNMADFGAGATMADFGEPPQTRRRRPRVAAAVLAALLLLVAAVAAVSLTGDSAEVDSVASTDTTAAAPEDDTTNTSEDLEAGTQSTLGEDDSSVTTVTGGEVAIDGESETTTTARSTTDTTAAAGTTTTVAGRTTNYDVSAFIESYATDGQARLAEGDVARGLVTITCSSRGACSGTLSIPDWDYTQSFSGTAQNGSLTYSETTPLADCSDGATVTNEWTGVFDSSTITGRSSVTPKPRTCQGTDGTPHFHEEIVVSFGTPVG